MARPCLICANGLSKYVRQLSLEGRPPRTIRQKLFDKYELAVNPRQLHHHTKYHDPVSGTVTIQRESAKKALLTAQSKVMEAEALYDEAKKVADDVKGFFSTVLGMQGQIDFDKLASLPPDKQVRMINDTIKSMVSLKKLELDQRRQNLQENFLLEETFDLMANAGRKKKKEK